MSKQNLAGKKVIILSDSELLFNVIAANLKQICPCLDWLAPAGSFPSQANPADLIIVATSSPKSEPVVVLYRAALVQQIGRTPLLIISERSFEASPEGKIFHLDFPFEGQALRRRVRTLLANGDKII